MKAAKKTESKAGADKKVLIVNGVRLADIPTEQVPLSDIKPYPHNTKKHTPKQMQMLMESINQYGFVNPILINQEGVIIAGHGRFEACKNLRLPYILARRLDHLTPAQEHALRIMDNRSALETELDLANMHFELDIIRGLDESALAFTGLTGEEFALVADYNPSLDVLVDPSDATQDPVRMAEAMTEEQGKKWAETQEWSASFPSSNDLGIPDLDPSMQATSVDLPLIIYGSTGRDKLFGTVCFYTNDWRFEALWKEPRPLALAPATMFIEPNFSIYGQSPLAITFYQTYRKRLLSRFWQSKGKRCMVDLHVPLDMAEACLLGVPKGWKAYATRGSGIEGESGGDYAVTKQALLAVHDIACQRAETKDGVLLAVYGGSRQVEEFCKQKGWYYFMEHMTQANLATRGKDTDKKTRRASNKKSN